MSAPRFYRSDEWQTPGPIRHTLTMVTIEDGHLVDRPIKNGEVVGGRYDGLSIPVHGVEWSEDGNTFTYKDSETEGT